MDESIQADEITAALNVLRESFDLGGYAKVSNYIWEGQTFKEREEGIRQLKTADELEESVIRIVVSDALRAARDAHK